MSFFQIASRSGCLASPVISANEKREAILGRGVRHAPAITCHPVIRHPIPQELGNVYGRGMYIAEDQTISEVPGICKCPVKARAMTCVF